MLLDFRTLMLWALGLGLAGALLIAGIERNRATNARAALSEMRAELAKERAEGERRARDQEQTWRSRVDGVIQDGQQQIAAARADADRAGARERGVRKQLDAFRVAVRAATAEARTSGASPPAEAALDLLANLLGGSGSTLVELGRFADSAHAAGSICERYVDATAQP